MTRQPIGHHGATHRPPGTLSVDDEGGEDPIQVPEAVFNGDYVFQDEVIVEANNDPIVIAGISQDYRHIRLFASLQQYGSSDSHSLCISLSGDDDLWMSGEIDHTTITSPDTAKSLTVLDTDSFNAAFIYRVLPGTNYIPFPGDSGNYFATLEMTIPYYYLEDRRHGILWQAGAIAPNSDEDNIVPLSSGYGSSTVDHASGVTAIRFDVDTPGAGGFSAGSIVSYYGVR